MAKTRHEKMYANSPRLERGEDGNMKTTKGPPTQADNENMGLAGNPLPNSAGELPIHHKHAADRREMHHRHAHEHLGMHHRHEMEHAHHEMVGNTDRSEVHKRHETEHQEMTKRHHDEMKRLHSRHFVGETDHKEVGSDKEKNPEGKHGKMHDGTTNTKNVHDETSKESKEYRKP